MYEPLHFLKTDSPSSLYKPMFFRRVVILTNLAKKYREVLILCTIVDTHQIVKQVAFFFLPPVILIEM